MAKINHKLLQPIKFSTLPNHSLPFEDVDILKNICEIRSKQKIIQDKIKAISINLADDSDLIFMGLVGAGEEITTQRDDIEMQISELQNDVENME